jgi:hypothetical protein
MKNRVNPFNEKICITINSRDFAHKKPVCFVTRRIFLFAAGLVFICVVGFSAYAGISAYVRMDKLSLDVSSMEAERNMAMAALNNAVIPPAEINADAAAAEDGSMPAIVGDEIAQIGTEDSERLTDPWLTVEAAPVVESIEYENGSVNGHIELIDWFNGGSEVYSRYTEATVIDVETGLSFLVRRFGGQYHGDSEPLTAEDTEIMKQIVGGQWTWDRHAIWLKIGERYIAASMNGMPHMTSPTPGNNFPGHFCIHFLHSKVHETGKECPKHQEEVIKAFASADKLDEYLQTHEY